MQITTLPKDDVKRGEIYYISRGGYNTGSEQQADRLGVIVSNDKNNKNSQTLEVVYLTTQPKNELPTHCTIRSTGRVSTVLCEQIHTVAVERIGKYIGVCTAQEMQNVRRSIRCILQQRRIWWISFCPCIIAHRAFCI